MQLCSAIANDKESHIIHRLSGFKVQGIVQYDRTLAIQSASRIPALTSTTDGYNTVFTVLTIAIKKAMDNMNLRLGMDERQLMTLAETIIDESNEDQLAIEDVLLFLQQLVRGKTEKIFDRMDIPSFMERFEVYRENRHRALIQVREEEQAQYKGYGDNTRLSDEHDLEKEYMHSAMSDYLRTHYEKGNDIKEADSRTHPENSDAVVATAGL